jgi:hypothetical protein
MGTRILSFWLLTEGTGNASQKNKNRILGRLPAILRQTSKKPQTDPASNGGRWLAAVLPALYNIMSSLGGSAGKPQPKKKKKSGAAALRLKSNS